MTDSAHAEHEGAFPRQTTAELVGRELEARERRERWQAPLVALGIVLLALAFPTEALLGQTLNLVEATARGAGVGLHLVPCAVARALDAGAGLDPEQAWFAVAALAFGATVLPLAAMGRERGWARGPALGTAIVALAAPLALVGGTLPDAASARLLGAALLCAELAREQSSAKRRALAWCLATALHLSNALTWPALIAAEWVARRPGTGDERESNEGAVRASALPAVAALLAFATVFLGLHAASGDLPSAVRGAAEHLLAGGPDTPGAGLAGWCLGFVALGAAGAGVVALVVRMTRGGGLRRELGLIVFGLAPAATQAGFGSSTWELPWLGLLPLGLLGLFDLLQLADERGRGALARLGAVPLVGLGLLGAVLVRAEDSHAAWRAKAGEFLEPGDVVLSASREHLYLFARRFRLETVDLRELARRSTVERERFWAAVTERESALRAEGRRLVLDGTAIGDPGARTTPFGEELERCVGRLQLPLLPEDGSKGSAPR